MVESTVPAFVSSESLLCRPSLLVPLASMVLPLISMALVLVLLVPLVRPEMAISGLSIFHLDRAALPCLALPCPALPCLVIGAFLSILYYRITAPGSHFSASRVMTPFDRDD